MTELPARHWLLGDARAFAARTHIFPWLVAQKGGGLGVFRVLHRKIYATCDAGVAHHVLVTGRDIWGRGPQARNFKIIVGDSLLTSEGPLWKARHEAVRPLLRRSSMEARVPAIQRRVAERLDDWAVRTREGTPLSLVPETQRLAMEIMAEQLLSTELEPGFTASFGAAIRDGLLLLRERNTSILRLPHWVPTARHRRLAACRREIDAFVGGCVDARLAAPGGSDILAGLMAARTEAAAPLDRAALIAEAKTLFVTGFETAATTLTWTLFLLAQHPQVADKWRTELDAVLGGRAPVWSDLPKLTYTSQILNESMRLYPAVYLVARRSVAADEIAGQHIPRGAIMLISIYGLHRDPVFGSDIEVFRPERFASDADWPRRSFMPFGAGEHVCLGSHFATTELMLSLAMIGQRFSLARADDDAVDAAARITLTPTRDIFVTLEPRRCAVS